MNNKPNAHQDVIERFISYGENNFELNTPERLGSDNPQQLGVLRLIYAYRFSGHLRAKIDPLNRPRHHSTPPFKISEFGLTKSDLDQSFNMGSYQNSNCSTLRE